MSCSCLIDGLCKAGRLKVAWKIFHKLSQEGLKPDVVTYLVMINGLCKDGQLEEATNLLSIMEDEGCAPDVITYNTLMRGFSQNNETIKVVELLHKMAERNIMPDNSTASVVVDLLVNDEKHRDCLNWLPSFPAQRANKKLTY
ncbi:hypothetical protein ACOSQ4_022243 [Xanthoceras sorbifolium]